VTLVERNASFVSCPISNLVVGGYKQMADITRGYDGLKAMGVKVVQGDVTAIDAAGKKVRLAGGTELAYDRLIVSPGIDFMTDAGRRPGRGAGQRPHRARLEGRPADRGAAQAARPTCPTAACTPSASPRCPTAARRGLTSAPAWWPPTSRRPSRAARCWCSTPTPRSEQEGLVRTRLRQHYKGILEYKPNAELKEVAGTVAKLEFEDVKADVLNVVPRSAPPIWRASPGWSTSTTAGSA
jgi:sulfide dehydrogenase [flavocytochrome c] flavoprotein subunit